MIKKKTVENFLIEATLLNLRKDNEMKEKTKSKKVLAMKKEIKPVEVKI